MLTTRPTSQSRYALTALAAFALLGGCASRDSADPSQADDAELRRHRRTADAGAGAVPPLPADASAGGAVPGTTGAPPAGGTSLLQASNLEYLGAFALPKGKFGTSSFDYGGHALAVLFDQAHAKPTLLLEGHAHNPGQVAQVEIPSTLVKSSNWNDLPQANVLQPFSDVTDGKLGEVDPTNTSNPTFIYGLLPYDGRLIVGTSNVYSPSQTVSHGVSGLDLSVHDDFRGWYGFGGVAASPRALGGWMLQIPSTWQGAFGGPAMTGNCCLSIIGTTSAGPSLTVFDPADVGVRNPLAGTTVLYYPIEHPLCGNQGCEATQNTLYNLTTQIGGPVFPAKSRSVLFVGATGIGPYCYNTAAACNQDTALPDVKGPHAQPYRYQVWAYDVNDLLAVKAGTKQPWDPRPYAVWALSEMPNSGNNNIKGTTYDADSGRIYIAQDYGNDARIEVYQVTTP